MCNLCLVVPCYNEEETLTNTYEKLSAKMKNLIDGKVIDSGSRVLMVNDGSRDNTWPLIDGFSKESDMFSGISFSRNFGHQSAVLAGMFYAVKNYKETDVVISIDADLQQDIDAIEHFIEEYNKGSEIVYGVRNDRNSDGLFKKVTAVGFYNFMNALGCNTIKNHADYRLVSKKAILELMEYDEVNLFLRGLIPSLGFKTSQVHFDVKERELGYSKYNLARMLSLAIDGITSFSIRPMRLIGTIGGAISVLSIVWLVVTAIMIMCGAADILAFIACSIWLFGGLILLSLGIIGEYIGKMYLETKRRPRFIIEKSTDESYERVR